MSSPASKGRIPSTLRSFLDNEASSGLILMAVAALALATANSPLAATYFHALHVYIGPLSLLHWINDALMAVFFLMVGLEIKREMLDGQLSSWPRRILPGGAALGGMLAPALVYSWFNAGNPTTAHGWAIPAATDIAFALGVLSLLGPRVPVTLKVFLTALAIIDDLGAVVIIAVFYTSGLNLMALGGAAAVFAGLLVINRLGIRNLIPFLSLGLVLWVLVFMSGVHATIAGVLLALTIPIKVTPGTPEATDDESPLHRLEHALHRPVSFVIVPIFGFANAGLSFAGVGAEAFLQPVTLGVGLGLLLGKLVGVLGFVWLMVKVGVADLPATASWRQMTGVALLCGIGFTMSLFVALLAFGDPVAQDQAKLGIIAGSTLAALAGSTVLAGSKRRPREPESDVR
jgi:NhaA family Na+:H+ antiporter